MQFICLQNEIKDILSHTESIVASKTTIPILSNVLIETKENMLKICATDLEIGFSSTIKAEIIEEGSITVHAKKFFDIVRSFPDIELKFTLLNNKLKIKATDDKIKTNFTLVALPKDDYPNIPLFVDHKVFKLNNLFFKDIIKKTISAASVDTSRYYLNGIFFEKKDDKLNFVATDGKRLAIIKTIDNNLSDIDDFSVIVPSKILYQLIKVLDGTFDDEDKDTECLISITEKKIFFKKGNMDLFSNLFEGQFPDYTEVVPKRDTLDIVFIDRMAFYDAIKRVSLVVDPRVALVKFDFAENMLSIYGNDKELGEAKDEINIDYKQEKKTIAFNYNYIIDAIKEIEEEQIGIYIKESSKPILIEGKDKENYFSVIMPMKLP